MGTNTPQFCPHGEDRFKRNRIPSFGVDPVMLAGMIEYAPTDSVARKHLAEYGIIWVPRDPAYPPYDFKERTNPMRSESRGVA